MVTDEQQVVIEKLKLELASKEKPCPECYDFEAPPIRLPDGTLQASDCTAKDCNGTGVVPLVSESRRVCPCIDAPFYKLQGICPFCASAERPFNTFGTGAMPHKERKGCICAGRGWIPDLDGWKVLAGMLSFGFSYIRLATDELYPGTIKLLFVFNGKDVLIEAKDLQEALLLACLAAIVAMNAKVEA